MTRNFTSSIGLFFIGSLLLSGCGSGSSNQSLACIAGGTVASGALTTPNSTVAISGITVQINNGKSGPYTVQLPGQTSQTVTQPSYTTSQTFSFSTAPTGGLEDPTVTVADASTGNTASCSLTPNETASTLTATYEENSSSPLTPLTVSASPASTATVGSTILLTAAYAEAGAEITFAATGSGTGVSVSITGAGTASVTSATAGTFTIGVEALVEGEIVATTQQTVTFTPATTTNTGGVQLVASSSSVAVGTSITVTASASTLSKPVYTFSVSGLTGATLTSSGSTATVTSSVAGSATVTVSAVQSGKKTGAITGAITVQFGSSATTTATALTCTLTATAGSYTTATPVSFTIVTNTGEAVAIDSWLPGMNWTTPPPFPLTPPVGVTYGIPGTYTVQMTAQSVSRPGTYCNGGAAMQTVVTVQ